MYHRSVPQDNTNLTLTFYIALLLLQYTTANNAIIKNNNTVPQETPLITQLKHRQHYNATTPSHTIVATNTPLYQHTTTPQHRCYRCCRSNTIYHHGTTTIDCWCIWFVNDTKRYYYNSIPIEPSSQSSYESRRSGSTSRASRGRGRM